MIDICQQSAIEQQEIGDFLEASFSALYAEYYVPGVRYVRRHFPKFVGDAEDIVQNAFVQIWKNQRWWQGDYEPGAIVYHHIYCEAVELYRSRYFPSAPLIVWSADMGSEENPSNGFPDWIASSYPSVEQQVIWNEKLQTIHQVIAGLPEHQQLAISLAGEGVDIEDIREALRRLYPMRGQSVHDLLNQARVALRRVLGRPVVQRARYYQPHETRRLGKWSKWADACLECGTRTIAHEGHGLCVHCYLFRAKQEKQGMKLRGPRVAMTQDICCRVCGKMHPHAARGMCKNCYARPLKQAKRNRREVLVVKSS